MKQEEFGETKGGGGLNRGLEYESRFAKAFIARNKRDRFIRIACSRVNSRTPSPASMKRNAKYRQMLSNLQHWMRDDVKLSTLGASDIAAEGLLERLVLLSAPRECYVMSLSRTVDGQFLPLSEAVQGLLQGDGQSTLLICYPDSLACFWHGEVQAASAILRMTRI